MTDTRLLAAAQVNRVAHAVFGIVSAVDPNNHAIKVRVQPEDIETGWMPDISGVQSGDLKISCPSSLGTHVVLVPVEGDAEQFIAVGTLFDSVVMPPRVPGEGRVIYPGEWLIQAGGGGAGQSLSQNTGGWILVSARELKMGLGGAGIVIKDKEIVLSVGGTILSLTDSGLVVRGGDICTDNISLNEHIHLVGSQKSTGPVS
ncbi:phage baseplate assembly protein V [Neokomagataea thailandica]|uniref:Phage-related baseplate assembly protein n=1 Tax=Neokomagataea tanensis NBRC 106556 TaxID=1223519 RepID=A0ABQ0QGS2_9PROT|nr:MULTISPECIES: phage baseplate assembly protein V [Neokomagataea]GBR44227.1 phage-related baseplate assembly protein [Neokomagataea tanensis NBRC 106556]